MRTLLLVVASLVLLQAIGCEPDLGHACARNPDVTDLLVERRPGANVVVADLRFDGCAEALCMSQDGGEPFCTRRCTSDEACADAPGFTCDDDVCARTNE